MLDIQLNRREMLRIGSVGVGASLLSVSDPLFAAEKIANDDRAIIWVWLAGGPTHFELFNAVGDKDGHRSVIGTSRQQGSPITMGMLWDKFNDHSDVINVVADFSHNDSSHRQATHWMNTAHRNPDRTTTATTKYPGHGPIISAIQGTSNEKGIPTFVEQRKIEGHSPAWLGGSHKGFDPNSKDNLTPRVRADRFSDRRSLLRQLDQAQIQGEQGRSVDAYKEQAFSTILGEAKSAFSDVGWDEAKAKYGDSDIGKQLWMAQRLTQHGSKFVTAVYGGWDMHSDIKNRLEARIPPIDMALGGLIEELKRNGRITETLIVVTGEFGRTRMNRSEGRDHWPALTPLAFAGGSYEGNRVIGEADKDNYTPKGKGYGPIDLQATLMDHMGIPLNIQREDTSGRPRYLVEGDHQVIL